MLPSCHIAMYCIITTSVGSKPVDTLQLCQNSYNVYSLYVQVCDSLLCAVRRYYDFIYNELDDNASFTLQAFSESELNLGFWLKVNFKCHGFAECKSVLLWW